MEEHLKELKNHGKALFPLHVYRHFDADGEYNVATHWHDEFEFIFLEYGEMLARIDGQAILLKAGECLCIHPGEVHSLESLAEIPSQHQAIVFPLHFLASAFVDEIQLTCIQPLHTGALKLPRHLAATTEYSPLLSHIQLIITHYHAKKIGYQLLLKASFYQFFALILAQTSDVALALPPVDPQIARIKQAISYFHTHYSDKIYIQSVADELHINHHYFCRTFKRVTGKTPIDYLNHYRLEQAETQLRMTREPIMTISLDVGFDNISYFIKLFKVQYGTTPAKYRKQLHIES